jgi:hypothetical protein
MAKSVRYRNSKGRPSKMRKGSRKTKKVIRKRGKSNSRRRKTLKKSLQKGGNDNSYYIEEVESDKGLLCTHTNCNYTDLKKYYTKSTIERIIHNITKSAKGGIIENACRSLKTLVFTSKAEFTKTPGTTGEHPILGKRVIALNDNTTVTEDYPVYCSYHLINNILGATEFESACKGVDEGSGGGGSAAGGGAAGSASASGDRP